MDDSSTDAHGGARIDRYTASGQRAYRRLTGYGFPAKYPIVQFPNAPLIVGIGAGLVARTQHGSAHDYLQSVSYLAMAVWAYEELIHGTNLFRRLLGLAYAVVLTVHIARAVGS